MPLRTADFESAMYTNFITPAEEAGVIIVACRSGRQPAADGIKLAEY